MKLDRASKSQEGKEQLFYNLPYKKTLSLSMLLMAATALFQGKISAIVDKSTLKKTANRSLTSFHSSKSSNFLSTWEEGFSTDPIDENQNGIPDYIDFMLLLPEGPFSEEDIEITEISPGNYEIIIAQTFKITSIIPSAEDIEARISQNIKEIRLDFETQIDLVLSGEMPGVTVEELEASMHWAMEAAQEELFEREQQSWILDKNGEWELLGDLGTNAYDIPEKLLAGEWLDAEGENLNKNYLAALATILVDRERPVLVQEGEESFWLSGSNTSGLDIQTPIIDLLAMVSPSVNGEVSDLLLPKVYHEFYGERVPLGELGAIVSLERGKRFQQEEAWNNDTELNSEDFIGDEEEGSWAPELLDLAEDFIRLLESLPEQQRGMFPEEVTETFLSLHQEE